MSDSRKKPGPPREFSQYPALLRADQIAEIRTAGPRNGNKYLRDLIDFSLAHKQLFFTWFTARRKNTTNGQDQP